MPQDPRAHFDELVLDLIEHSPVGAVPHTPSYVEALTRLYATHQVYASADHKGGHVTARSLAARPAFLANNLEALIAGQIDPAALESNRSIFDRYVAALPPAGRTRAEQDRLRVTGKPIHHRKHHGPGAAPAHHDPVHSLFLVPGAGLHHGLPGNYLYGSLFHSNPEAATWAIHLHDAEDGAAFFDAPDLASALGKLQEVVASAPFHLAELEVFGFRAN